MASVGRRVVVVGATGNVGAELLALLERRRFPLEELRAHAGEDSLGEVVDFQGEGIEVETGTARLAGADLAFLCAPPGAALDAAQQALRHAVPCIDLSGALAAREEVPLVWAEGQPSSEQLRQPALSALSGAALAWTLVLGPLHAQAGVTRVIGTALEAASGAGRRGVEALGAESVALFNQQDPPEPEAFAHPVAFDCVPICGVPGAGGMTDREQALAAQVRRALGGQVAVAATAVQTPVFCGDGGSLLLETERTLDPDDALTALGKSDAVRVWPDPSAAISTRSVTGINQVLVGRVRRDPSSENGLMLWLAADLPRISALNAVQLAEARFAPA